MAGFALLFAVGIAAPESAASAVVNYGIGFMPVIPAVLSALCYVFYKFGCKLTGEFYEKMIRELRARKEQ